MPTIYSEPSVVHNTWSERSAIPITYSEPSAIPVTYSEPSVIPTILSEPIIIPFTWSEHSDMPKNLLADLSRYSPPGYSPLPVRATHSGDWVIPSVWSKPLVSPRHLARALSHAYKLARTPVNRDRTISHTYHLVDTHILH